MRASSPGYARFAWGTLAGTLLVILWGAFVRASGSGAGCGSHWPLCNGEIVPHSAAWATIVEFGHRATSGLALLAVVGLWWGARSRFSAKEPTRRAAGWSLFFMVTEALIGAGLVLLEYVADDTRVARGFWVAGHLLNTFFLVAALTACAGWASGMAPPSLRGRRSVVTLLALASVGVLLIGVSGAVTALGDTLFPVSSYEEGRAATFSETAHIFVRLRIWHPMLAVLVGFVVLLTAGLVHRASPGPAVRRAALSLVTLYTTQMLIGLLNLWWLAPTWLQLTHLLVADLIWIELVLLALAALARPASCRGVAGPAESRAMTEDPVRADGPAEAPPQSLREIPHVLGNARRAFGLLVQADGRLAVSLVVLTLGAALLPVSIAWVGKRLIDDVVAAGQGDVAAGSLALWWVALEFVLVLARSSIAQWTQLAQAQLRMALGLKVNTMILEKAVNVSYGRFEDPTFNDQLSQARREASSRPLDVVRQLLLLLRNVITLAGYATILAGFSGWAVLALLSSTLPPFIAEARFGRKAFLLNRSRMFDNRRAHYIEVLLSREETAKEVSYSRSRMFCSSVTARFSRGFIAKIERWPAEGPPGPWF